MIMSLVNSAGVQKNENLIQPTICQFAAFEIDTFSQIEM